MDEASNSYWLINAVGHKAVVTSQSECDRWRAYGWTAGTAPEAGDLWVWLEHREHRGRALFPVPAVTDWRALGWEPGPPSEPTNLTKDPQFVDPSADVPDINEPPRSPPLTTRTTAVGSSASTQEE